MADEEVTLDHTSDAEKPQPLQSGRVYNIKIKVNTLSISLHFDPEDPSQQDDSATLESTDGSYRKTLPLNKGKAEGNSVVLKFRGVKPDKSYNFLIDPGAEGPAYYVAKNIPLSKDQLSTHMAG